LVNERGDEVVLVPVGAAVELLYHSATIFDDIQDSSEARYGLPAAWKLYGKERAINIGIWLLSASNLIVTSSRMPSDITVLAVAAVNRAVGNMTRGQWSDLSLERPDLQQCLELSGRKTGALIAAGLHLGAIAARVPIDRHPIWLDAGYRLGEALQLHDDLEDLIDRFAAGGPRWTSAVAAVYPHLREEVKRELDNAMARSDARQFTAILADHGASQMLFSLSAASAAAARKLLGHAGLQKQAIDSLYNILGLHRM
jgi:geranylgeranyl pyrophosphate synthase